MPKKKPTPIQVHHNERIVGLLDFVHERRVAGKDDKYIAGELGITPKVLALSIERAKQNGDPEPKSVSEDRKSRSERRAEAHAKLVEKVLDLGDKNLTNVEIGKELGIAESAVVSILKKYRPTGDQS